MRFSCPDCQTPYHVPDERLREAASPGGVRTKCNICGVGLIIDVENERVRKDPFPRENKTFRRDFPSVLSMSKEAKKEKDVVAGIFLALMLLLGIGAGYHALTRLETRPFTAAIRTLADFKDAFSIPRIFREVTGERPSIPANNGTHPGRRLVRKGYAFYSKERLDPALETFDEAIRLDPNNPQAHYWRGRTLLKMGKEEPAMEAFKAALTLHPDYWEALDNVGWLHLRRGEYGQGLAALNRSIEVNPDNAWAYYNRGFLHAKTGNSKMALKDAQTACRMGYRKACQMAEKYGKSKETATPSQDG